MFVCVCVCVVYVKSSSSQILNFFLKKVGKIKLTFRLASAIGPPVWGFVLNSQSDIIFQNTFYLPH
jgi:hypothetical protein